MQIINSLDNLDIKDKTSVALGNFDGLHIGHRKIMEDATKSACDGGLKSLCFTFSNHPFNYIMHRKESDPDAVKLICSEDDKIRMIENMGFDILVNVPFDENIMTMAAGDFFKDILVHRLNAACISVGFNYSYGARGGGNSVTLRAECEAAGIGVNIHEAVRVENEVVSSTLIREMIRIGNMELTALYLGRPYAFKGTVTHGKRLGSSMGIPTVNIPAPMDIALPPSGVYFSRTVIGGSEYKSVSNIGVRPTVSDIKPQRMSERVSKTTGQSEFKKNIETNIFGFNDDLYGREIEVYFDHFSRGEVKFASKEELFGQIEKDRKDAERYHKITGV